MGRKGSGLAVLAVVAAMFCLVFTGQAFALSDDSVMSQHVLEADGTSGQDTNSGSGIKTGHIQDGAVTTQKIVDGAVTDDKISGTISGSKLGSHTHNGADITDGTVSTSKIADGAVTDAKITGPISGSKISSSGLDSDTVDGQHAADLAPAVHGHDASDIVSGTIGVDKLATYSGVRIVHKGVADGVNTFNTISAALSSITDNSASKRYAVMVMPGIYNGTVYMKSYVDIVGSGQGNTILEYDVTSSPVVSWPSSVNKAALENLTVRGVGSSGPGTMEAILVEGSAIIRGVMVIASNYSQAAIYHYRSGYLEIYRSTVLIEAGSNSSTFIIDSNGAGLLIKDSVIDITMVPDSWAIGIYGNNVTLDNSIVKLDVPDGGYGVMGYDNMTISNSTVTVTANTDYYGNNAVEGSNMKIHNSTVIASAATTPYNDCAGVKAGGNFEVNNSVVSGTNFGIKGNFKIGNSQIVGGHDGTAGSDKVVNCYDGSYNPITDL